MTSPICTIGDTHGHLQLVLCMVACWQREQNTTFEAVFLCGDVGTFISDDQLDKATQRHGKANPCELEFLYQWSVAPFPAWLRKIFEPLDCDGLGQICPVVMVHGNHEGFSHLQTLIPNASPDVIHDMNQLPTVDTGGCIRYLPSGFRCRTASGKIIGGIGGIEPDQRKSKYHDLAYLNQSAIQRFLDNPPIDLLITHQGPSSIQSDGGSDSLQKLLNAKKMRCWCHGHSVCQPGIVDAAPNGKTRVVPLEDATFEIFAKSTGKPGRGCFAAIDFDSTEEPPQVEMIYSQNWHNYRREYWHALDEQRLVCPDLIRFV